jgi:hypothetical protein
LVASNVPAEKVSLKVGGFTAGTLRTSFIACPVPFWADRETMNSDKTIRNTLRMFAKSAGEPKWAVEAKRRRLAIEAGRN